MIPAKKRLPESALDINLPDRRAKRCTPPRAAAPPPLTEYQKNQADREKWMREKQEKKRRDEAARKEQIRRANLEPSPRGTRQLLKEQRETKRLAPIEGRREAQLLAEAESEIRRRRLTEQRVESDHADTEND